MDKDLNWYELGHGEVPIFHVEQNMRNVTTLNSKEGKPVIKKESSLILQLFDIETRCNSMSHIQNEQAYRQMVENEDKQIFDIVDKINTNHVILYRTNKEMFYDPSGTITWAYKLGVVGYDILEEIEKEIEERRFFT